MAIDTPKAAAIDINFSAFGVAEKCSKVNYGLYWCRWFSREISRFSMGQLEASQALARVASAILLESPRIAGSAAKNTK